MHGSVERVRQCLHDDDTASIAKGVYACGKDTVQFVKSTKLPTDIEDYVSLGVFPEIHRAYAIKEDTLTLWNYEDGTSQDIIRWVSDNGSTIIAVHLAFPKEREFHSDVCFVLLVSTNNGIVLLEVTFEDNFIDRRMYLEPSRFTISTYGVRVVQFASTLDGRIFAADNNGALYCIDYESTWYRRSAKCRKAGSNRFLQIIGLDRLFNAFSKDAVQDLFVSKFKSFHFLCKLTESGALSLYEIRQNALHLRATLADPKALAESAYRATASKSGSEGYFSHLSSFFQKPQQSGIFSSDDHLVAVCAGGVNELLLVCISQHAHRISLQYDVSSASFSVSQVDLFPPIVQSSLQGDGKHRKMQGSSYASHSDGAVISRPTNVYKAIGQLGVTVGANVMQDYGYGKDELLFIHEVPMNQQRMLIVNKVMVENLVFDLKEDELIFDQSPVAMMIHDDPSSFQRLCNTFALQHLSPRRRFICATSKEVSQYILTHPIDGLVALFEADAVDEQVYSFLDQFDRSEQCCMCLCIGCGMNEFELSGRVREHGVTWFWKIALARRKWRMSKFSDDDGVYVGVYKLFSRLIRPFWDKMIHDSGLLHPSPDALMAKGLDVSRVWLLSLSEFMSSEDMRIYLKGSVFQRTKVDEDRWIAYTNSMEHLKMLIHLLDSTIYVVEVLIALSKQPDPNEIVSSLSKADQVSFLQLRLSDLITLENGPALTKKLIHAIMQKNPDNMSWLLSLRDKCSDAITSDEVDEFGANQMLVTSDAVQKSGSSSTKMIELYKRAASRRSFNVKLTAENLRKHNLIVGIVDLCLHRAWLLQQGQVEGVMDDEEQENLLSEAYEVLAYHIAPIWSKGNDALRSSVVAAIEASTDRIFHYFLYEWLLDNGRDHELKHEFRYVQPFLFETQRYEMLMTFYEENELFEMGAMTCLKVASEDDASTTLQYKIALLKQGIQFGRIARESPASSDCLFRLRQMLTFADIQSTILRMVSGTDAAEEDDRIKELSYKLIPNANQLCQIAEDFQLWEVLLEIKFVLRDRDQHYDSISIWDSILGQCNSLAAIEEKVVSLGKRYQSVDYVFPLRFIINKLASAQPSMPRSIEYGVLAIEIMQQIAIPPLKVCEAVADSMMSTPYEKSDVAKVALFATAARFVRDVPLSLPVHNELVSILSEWSKQLHGMSPLVGQIKKWIQAIQK